MLLFLCIIQQTESRPLNLAKTAKKLLKILGKGTFYDVSVGTGSCGKVGDDKEMVVAVNHVQMKNGKSLNCSSKTTSNRTVP
jgi:putative methionine-R-sulfoxide reductase with GAF domain